MRSFFILMTSWNNVLWLAILHYIRLYIAHNPIDILREPFPIFHSYRVGTEWKQLYVHTFAGPDSKLCVAYKYFLPSCQFLLSFFISSFYLFHFPQLCALLSLHLNAKCGLMSEAEKLKASNTQIQAVGSLRYDNNSLEPRYRSCLRYMSEQIIKGLFACHVKNTFNRGMTFAFGRD